MKNIDRAIEVCYTTYFLVVGTWMWYGLKYFSRYVILGNPFLLTEEFARFFFIWLNGIWRRLTLNGQKRRHLSMDFSYWRSFR